MGLMKKVFGNTRKPEGTLGRMMARGMNTGGHQKLAEWGLSHLRLKGGEQALDLGCGGGGNVERLLGLLPEGRVTGLDYSPVSVEVAKQTNALAIQKGKCRILQGNVKDLPLEDAAFDLATAFETVYFWPEMEKCFGEVRRVLRPGGTFMITNESDGRKGGIDWTRVVEGMTVYTGEQLKEMLEKAGFTKIETDGRAEKGWLCVLARA